MTRPDDCRYRVLSRDDPERYACGRQFPSQELTYDHPIPRSRGGKTVWTNIVTAGLSCNAQNVDKLPNHSGRKAAGKIRPLKPPRQPTAAQLLRARLEFLPSDVIEDFGSYLYWNAEPQT